MRKTTLNLIVGAGLGVGLVQRAGRAHPRRDPDGHDDADKKVVKKPVIIQETPAEIEAREAKEALELTKTQTAWCLAELNHKLDEAKAQNQTDEERALERVAEERAAERVATAQAGFEQQLQIMREQLVDSAIDTALATNSVDRKDVEPVLATLDRAKFLGEDGTVNKEVISAWAKSLGTATTKTPPRTNGSRSSDDDRGFGRYATQKD